MSTDTKELRNCIALVEEFSKSILERIEAGTYNKEQAETDLEELGFGDYGWYSALEDYIEANTEEKCAVCEETWCDGSCEDEEEDTEEDEA